MFHSGELAVQQRAGVRQFADRLEGMLDPPNLLGGLGRFLAGRTYAAMSAKDDDGRLWVSPLFGDPGFLDVLGPNKLRVHATPAAGDPLHELAPAQGVGLLMVEYAIRRRVRVNGWLLAASGALDIDVTEAFGNCPQNIPARPLVRFAPAPAGSGRATLTEADRALITSADTFILGTTNATSGNDASHRGGPPGFVQVDASGTTVTWPDYPGNNMFNSLGNLALDPMAALLFVDFATGTVLQLTGTAEIAWAGTERSVVFHLAQAVLSAGGPGSPS
jgi:hypothetical protein